jgi:hypothetical protein
MNSPFSSMPVMQSSSPSFSAFSDLTSNTRSFRNFETEEEYHYELLATASDVYDTELDNMSDLDPHDPATIRNFVTWIGPSEFSSPETRSDSEEEYEADDEGSGAIVEGLDFDGSPAHAQGLSPIIEEETDGNEDCETKLTEFIRYMTEDWTLDPEEDHEVRHPAFARRATVPTLDSDLSFGSKRTHRSPCWTGGGLSLECRASNMEMPNFEPQLSAPDLSPARSTAEYFNHFARPSHYPEAAEFFAVGFGSREFTNPFTASRPSGGRPASPPSPLTRPNDYGLVETWNFKARKAQSISPVSSASNYSQFRDDSQPASPLSDSPLQCASRESSILGLGISITLLHSSPTLNVFPSLSRASSSSSSSGPKLFSALDLIAQLDDLLFDNAAYEFFSALDIEGLIADQVSNGYVFENHDTLHDPWELEHEWPYRMWLPHQPKRSCHCWWCIEYWVPSDEEEAYMMHDFDRRCYCPVCESFRCAEMVREMEKWEQGWATDKEQIVKEEGKRKREQSKSQYRLEEHEARPQLRREIRKLKGTQTSDEERMVEESNRTFPDEGELRVAIQWCSHIQPVDGDLIEEDIEGQQGEKKRCLGLFDWIKRQLRKEHTY